MCARPMVLYIIIILKGGGRESIMNYLRILLYENCQKNKILVLASLFFQRIIVTPLVIWQCKIIGNIIHFPYSFLTLMAHKAEDIYDDRVLLKLFVLHCRSNIITMIVVFCK
jgi:hypothetical protein